MALTPTSKNNPCPICENTSGKCRQSREDENYWLCMTYADAKKGESIGGYKCIGHTKDKLWGQFKPDNSDKFTNQGRSHVKRIQQKGSERRSGQTQGGVSSVPLSEIQGQGRLDDTGTMAQGCSQLSRRQEGWAASICDKTGEHDARNDKHLSPDLRHEQYKRIDSELGYHPDDLRDFDRRGLTENQILTSGFKSIEAFQKLQGQYSDLLPGVKGNQLMIGQAGYLCPVRDVDGRIVAYQIRVRDADDGGRYRWLSSRHCKGSLHLDGELPLAVHRPEGKPEGIALTEGTGAKPFLVSQRLNSVVIGAAGGQWDSSKKTFKRTIDKLSAELGIKEITLYPDAGDILNSQVMGRWQRAIALLGQWGWLVKVAWWGQRPKVALDIDELTDYNEIQYLSPEQFAAIAEEKEQQTETQWTDSSWARSYLAALNPERANDYDCWLRIGIALRSVGDPNLLDDWVKFSKQSENFQPGECERKWGGFKPGKIGLGTLYHYATEDGWENPLKGTEQFINTQEDYWRKIWIKSRKFTPDITINQSFFTFDNIDIPNKDVIVGVLSGLGTGKTEGVLPVIKNSGRGSRWIGYRNNLLYQTCDRAERKGLSINHLHKDDSFELLADSHAHISFCLDSITHSSPSYFEGTDIVMDESCSVLLHGIDGGTLGDQQSFCLEILKQALQECDRVFLLDGNLRDIDVELIRKLAKNKQVIKIKNEWKGAPHDITFVTGIDLDGEIKKRDHSPLTKSMLQEGVTPWIATDSKERSKVVDELLKQTERKGFVLNSETSPEPWAKEFLKNPTEFVEKNKQEYGIISPSGESGIDVHGHGHFTHKFTILSGVLSTNSQTQIMFRLRDNIPHYVFCPEQGLATDRNTPRTYSVKKFQEQSDKFILQSAAIATESLGLTEPTNSIFQETLDRSDDNYWEYSCLLGALDQYENDHLRECLIYALREAGNNVTEVNWETDKQTKAQEKQTSEQVKLTHATEVHTATDIPFEEAKSRAKSGKAGKSEQRQIEKAFLLQRLPGIQESEQWSSDLILKYHIKNKDFITQQERLWLLRNTKISERRHEIDWYYHIQKEFFYKGGARKAHHSTIWALDQLKIERFLIGDWHKESPEVIDLNEKGRQTDIVLALGFAPTKARKDGKERIEYLKRVLDLVGVKLKNYRKVTLGNQRLNTFSLDKEHWNDINRLTIELAIERKFLEWFNSEKAKVDWSAAVSSECPQQEKPSEDTPSNSPQSLAKSATEASVLRHLPLYRVNTSEDSNLVTKSQGESDTIKSQNEDNSSNLVTESDIGRLYKVRQFEGSFGTVTTTPSVTWLPNYRLVKLPSKFQDYYVFETPEGKWISVADEDGFEPMEEAVAPSLGQQVAEAFKAGVDAVKGLLGRLGGEIERFAAMEAFEAAFPAQLAELMAIAPDCWQWCWM